MADTYKKYLNILQKKELSIDMEQYSLEPHRPTNIKGISWRICAYCGLIYLNNPLTKWSIEKGCNNKDYPGYKEIAKRIGRNV